MAIVRDLSGNSSYVDTHIAKEQIKLKDGVTAPAAESGVARMYIDAADGDLKIKFGDGVVKTIATDA